MTVASLRKRRNEKDQKLVFSLTRRKTMMVDVISRLIRNRLGMVGLVIVVILLILVIGAPLFTRYDYAAQDLANEFVFPCKEHIMGTDNFGRDLWSRLLYGGRISMLIAIMASALSMTIGMIIGSIAGYFGGKVDTIITRLLDIIMSIPSLLLAVAISSALGSGPFNTVLAIAISGIPGGARIMRSTVMSIKSNEFVEAAMATGSSNMRIVFKHLIPNAIAPLLLNGTMAIGGAIMSISGLSFVGLGVQPPTPEWGSILNAGRPYIRDFWPMIVFPAIFITLIMFGINVFGDALRDALDPRLKE